MADLASPDALQSSGTLSKRCTPIQITLSEIGFLLPSKGRHHHFSTTGKSRLKKLLRSRRWIIPVLESDMSTRDPPPDQLVTPKMEEHEPTRRTQELWEAVQQRKGQSIRAIAKELGVHRKTVIAYLEAGRPSVYVLRQQRRTNLTSHMSYLHSRWNQGCHNARRLFYELRERGYSGGETQVKDAVRPWRAKQSSTPPRLKASSINWLVLRPINKLSTSEKDDLDRLLQANRDLALGYHLKEGYRRLVAEQDIEALNTWVQAAVESGLKPFQSVARGFANDLDAIKLALTLPWSTAQCEGQICRVKLIKRQGYGRAKLDLLRQRILHRSVIA